jgi:hypothetical protein
MDVETILWGIICAVTLYMTNFFFCWIMLDLLVKIIFITDEETVWPLSLFLYIYDVWFWTPFDEGVWDDMPNFFSLGFDPWVLFFVWVLPDRLAALRPDLAAESVSGRVSISSMRQNERRPIAWYAPFNHFMYISYKHPIRPMDSPLQAFTCQRIEHPMAREIVALVLIRTIARTISMSWANALNFTTDDESNNIMFPSTPAIPAKTTWTLLIYLTSPATGCHGGETIFYPELGQAKRFSGKSSEGAKPVSVGLEVGMALLHKQ